MKVAHHPSLTPVWPQPRYRTSRAKHQRLVNAHAHEFSKPWGVETHHPESELSDGGDLVVLL